jgi:hypothetical protein
VKRPPQYGYAFKVIVTMSAKAKVVHQLTYYLQNLEEAA